MNTNDKNIIPLFGLLSAEFLSLLGNQITAVAIPVLVLEYTQSPIAAGFAGAANVLPVIFSAIIGGRIIDTFGAVRSSIGADLMSFLSVLLLPLALMYFANIPVIIIFLLVLLGALFDPTGVTARQTMVPQLVQLSKRDLGQINGYRGALENGADLLGPAIGGILITVIGIVNTFFVNAVSFLACALIVYLGVPYKTILPSKQPEVGLLLGVRYIIHNHQLRAMSLMGITSSFVLLPFLGLLLPVFITQNFDSPLWLGMCLSTFGGAATLGALLFRMLEGFFSRTTVYYSGFMLTSLSIMAFSFVASIPGIVVLALCAGLLLGAGNPLEQTVLQEVVPKNIAGQVFTSYGAIRFVTGPLGLICAGVLVELAGVPVVFIAAGALLLVVSLIGWLMAPLSATTV